MAKKAHAWWNENRKRWRRDHMDAPAEIVGWTTNYSEINLIDNGWDSIKLAMEIWEKKKEFNSRQKRYIEMAMISKLED